MVGHVCAAAAWVHNAELPISPPGPAACQPAKTSHPCPHVLQVNYTLMVTAMGFLQVLLLVRQMESVTTQALAARVSLLTLAHQVGVGWRGDSAG